MSIKKKILLYTLPFFLLSAVLSVVIGIRSLRQQEKSTIATIRQTMRADKEEKIKDLVTNAYEILAAQQRAASNPEMIAVAYQRELESLVSLAYSSVEAIARRTDLSETEQKELAFQTVAAMRYGGDNYLWINDMHPRMVMHPIKPEMNGQDLSSYKDPAGKLLFVEFTKVAAAEGKGFVPYLWPRPGHDKPVAKLSYVQLFKPWNWVIGTGVYLEAAAERFKEEAKKQINAMKFGPAGKDTFFIVDTSGKMLVNPGKPDTVGKDQLAAVDDQGEKYIAKIVDLAKDKGDGYVQCHWKDGSGKLLPKLTYIKKFPEWNWVVGSGVFIDDIDTAIAAQETSNQAAIRQQSYVLAGAGALLTLLVGLLLAFISHRIAAPVKEASLMLKDIAEGEGDLTRRLRINTGDELADLANWFNVFMEKLQTMIGHIGTDAKEMLSSSVVLADTSTAMSAGAEASSEKTTLVAAATEQMSANMATISTAVDETTSNVDAVSGAVSKMTATIGEIAATAEKARGITEQAVVQATAASRKVDELGTAAQEINKVLETIAEISDQVDLLALNATIEAARAGDAGKGFAVVASEIKELAKQTSTATGQIRERIEGIQSTTRATVEEIRVISEVVSENNQIVHTIAAAVEEQSTTAGEIASTVEIIHQGIQEINGNVAQSSAVSKEIAQDIQSVYRASSEMSGSASTVSHNASRLSKLAEGFSELVGRFKV